MLLFLVIDIFELEVDDFSLLPDLFFAGKVILFLDEVLEFPCLSDCVCCFFEPNLIRSVRFLHFLIGNLHCFHKEIFIIRLVEWVHDYRQHLSIFGLTLSQRCSQIHSSQLLEFLLQGILRQRNNSEIRLGQIGFQIIFDLQCRLIWLVVSETIEESLQPFQGCDELFFLNNSHFKLILLNLNYKRVIIQK